MAILEKTDYGSLGFAIAEAVWCVLGAVFVSNWRMRYWTVPVFALLVVNTFGYALITILLIFIALIEKPRRFVSVVFVGFGIALNFLGASLMVVRIYVFREPDVAGEKPYHYVSEGFLAVLMYVCAATMLLDITYSSSPVVIETRSSSEEDEEDEGEDGVRTQHTEMT